MIINNYNYSKIEKTSSYYLKHLEKYIIYSNKKYYSCISMFPYPSGLFHIGHFRIYIIVDVVCRYLCLNGYKSIGFFSWDSFGLPAEVYALNNKSSPFYWTNKNISLMIKQLLLIYLFINWRRQFTTNSNRFCRINQNLFNIFINNNIIFLVKSWVNWDIINGTELSNEQCLDNLCWRSNIPIIKKYIYSYYLDVLSISKLLNKLTVCLNNKLIIKSQINWIGYKNINSIYIYIYNYRLNLFINNILLLFILKSINVSLGNYEFFNILGMFNNRLLNKFLCCFKLNFFSGLYCVIYIYNKIYIPIYIINDTSNYIIINVYKYYMYILYGFISNYEYRIIIFNLLNIFNFSFFKISNWNISRHRYWGTPIPVIYCSCNNFIIDNSRYPINVSSFCKFNINEFHRRCFNCYKFITIKSITIDTFFDSSWYFISYFTRSFLFKKIYLTIDIYFGGKEHTILHLLYVRIIFIYLYYLGIIINLNPFNKILLLGLVLNKNYILKNKFRNINRRLKYLFKYKLLIYYITKMSKSSTNYLNPKVLVKNYGSDVLRYYLIFYAPIFKDILWTDRRILGSYRFIIKLWKLIFDNRNYIKNKLLNLSIIFSLYKDILLIFMKIYFCYRSLKLNLICSYLNILLSKLLIINQYILNNINSNIYIKFIKLFILFIHPICPSLSIIIFNILDYFNKNIYNINLYDYYI